MTSLFLKWHLIEQHVIFKSPVASNKLPIIYWPVSFFSIFFLELPITVGIPTDARSIVWMISLWRSFRVVNQYRCDHAMQLRQHDRYVGLMPSKSRPKGEIDNWITYSNEKFFKRHFHHSDRILYWTSDSVPSDCCVCSPLEITIWSLLLFPYMVVLW